MKSVYVLVFSVGCMTVFLVYFVCFSTSIKCFVPIPNKNEIRNLLYGVLLYLG